MRKNPEFEEWDNARRWIRKHCKLKWFRRNFSVPVRQDGAWLILEIYPDGDCAMLCGNNKAPRYISLIHRYDSYEAIEQKYTDSITDYNKRMYGFVAPKNASLRKLDGRKMLEESLACEPLVFLANNWWLIRSQIKLVLKHGPDVGDIVSEDSSSTSTSTR